jgi:hypothetical protein
MLLCWWQSSHFHTWYPGVWDAVWKKELWVFACRETVLRGHNAVSKVRACRLDLQCLVCGGDKCCSLHSALQISTNIPSVMHWYLFWGGEGIKGLKPEAERCGVDVSLHPFSSTFHIAVFAYWNSVSFSCISHLNPLPTPTLDPYKSWHSLLCTFLNSKYFAEHYLFKQL